MARPQRHRLLHGFPLAAAMPYASRDVRRRAAAGEAAFRVPYDTTKGLLVGVLPHPFCNPKVQGCGFCTFPHETYSNVKGAAAVAAVLQEIDDRMADRPELAGRRVDGFYFGGGTANLTPAEPFRRLCQKVNETFDLSQAEISLEGVPAYFVRRRPLLIDIMQEEISARRFRISMGIQTFDEERLAKMGRLAFGRPETFAAAVNTAHDRGLTVSGDLLFDLPGQSLAEMQHDLQKAIDIGLDQICLYHLVMFRGLGTAWSRDDDLLAQLPTNDEAEENWLVLRQSLLQAGYRQTTLTNFEREEVCDSQRGYQYERMSFQPDRYNMLGFGPAGISYAATSQYGLKTLNPESSSEYLQAVHAGPPVWNRYYAYRQTDVKLLHITRYLAGLQISRAGYRSAHGSDLVADFPEEFAALQHARLIRITDEFVQPTPRGMFYADSIAGLLADRRLRRGRFGADEQNIMFPQDYDEPAPLNDNGKGHM